MNLMRTQKWMVYLLLNTLLKYKNYCTTMTLHGTLIRVFCLPNQIFAKARFRNYALKYRKLTISHFNLECGSLIALIVINEISKTSVSRHLGRYQDYPANYLLCWYAQCLYSSSSTVRSKDTERIQFDKCLIEIHLKLQVIWAVRVRVKHVTARFWQIIRFARTSTVAGITFFRWLSIVK